MFKQGLNDKITLNQAAVNRELPVMKVNYETEVAMCQKFFFTE